MSTTRTLIVRLSGPLQSWGEVSRFSRRGTLPYPTYSALCGLVRCAAGLPREDPGTDLLEGVAMIIRLDAPGAQLTDYHTVNPKHPRNYREMRKLNQKDSDPLVTVMTDRGAPWKIDNQLASLQTYRTYLTDATFLWLLSGTEAQIERIREALVNPVWAVSLGRKTCVPDWPYLLGAVDAPAREVVELVPVVAHDPTPRPVEFHILNPELVPVGTSHTEQRTHADTPAPGGHLLRQRRVEWVVPRAVVASRTDLLEWAAKELQ
jgi:CRISPR system Cascade subunit CasD